MVRKQSKGTCLYCGKELSKAGITKHLATCPQRQTAIAAAEGKKGSSEALYHLRVQDADRSEFWLDLEMRGSKALKDLDDYLRAIWLECCGHMSQFSLGGGFAREVGKRRKISDIFTPGVELTHIYDFGTSSETIVKCAGVREGKPLTTKAIVLMARNSMPEYPCITCGKPATHLCMECLIEDQTEGTLCDEHTQDHPHDDYGEPIPLVNSPRMGMCGYGGPAEPPY
ncbi:hypothetical protein BST81_21640 [Leptolyngbya sp. 'hensonii']|uniref:hypothetical protein n=1 Tax=Leptolyngbya sp. 'hensonii' TaxID=1922337 RepID=UPI00095F74F6|nr:hypothetical protein [Leptolyngbya sp. 'hensonii']OLP16393.1 hypothetical protein BST81_21640 [Leptolyngbya sp. 'hensonii']